MQTPTTMVDQDAARMLASRCGAPSATAQGKTIEMAVAKTCARGQKRELFDPTFILKGSSTPLLRGSEERVDCGEGWEELGRAERREHLPPTRACVHERNSAS